MKNFVLIGAAGFIAPRHMRAIKDTNNNLIASLDPSDNVGILDSFFPESNFFTDFSRLDRYLSKIALEGEIVDYITICTPNYLHDFYIRYALKNKINVICEKPLVINSRNLKLIQSLEKKSKKNVYTILQLRHHPQIIKLSKELKTKKKCYDIELTYITSRGKWYHISWKGDTKKSGGILMNIGIHLFDLLIFLFGDVKSFELHYYSSTIACGYLDLTNARVKWFLSIDQKFLPKQKNSSSKTFRSIKVDNEDINLDYDFNKLHTVSYLNILNGYGFGIEDSIKSLDLVNKLNKKKTSNKKDNFHPLMSKIEI